MSDEISVAFSELSESALKAAPDIQKVLVGYKVGETSAIEFAKGIKSGSIQLQEGQSVLQGYQTYLKSTSSALSLAEIKTKALSASMKALSTIGWMAIFAIASNVIGLVVEKFDELKNKVENTKNSANDLISTLSSVITQANSNADTIESLSSKYETLSKGVNNLGENVSLTTDEYKEYNNIVNQIADMFPNLISGYTNEGNAILSLKGNVEQLRDAYKDAQKEAYNMLVASGENSDGNDIIKDYQNVVSGFKGAFAQDEMGAKQIVDMLTELNSSFGDVDKFKSVLNEFQKLANENNEAYHSKEFQGILDDIGINDLFGSITSLNSLDDESLNKASDKIAEHFSKIKATIQTYQAEIDSVLNNTRTLANAYLMTNDDYEKLDDQSKNAASVIVNSLNENIASGFESKEDVGAYVQDILNTINSNSEVKSAMVGLLTLDYSDMPVEKSVEIINQYINYIAEMLGENPLDLKIRLGFDDFDTLETQYKNAISSAQEKFGKDETGFFESNSINTKEEIDAWLGIAQAASSAEEAERKYIEQGKTVSAPSFIPEFENLPTDKIEEYVSLVKSGNIDEGTISSYSELNDLMQKTGMSAEDAAKALKDYADGYKLSTDLTANIQDAYDLLQDVEEQYKKTGLIGLSSLESIANTYPQLRSAVNEYTQGLISADDMMNQLHIAYENDANAYKSAMAYKLSGNEEFFTTIFNNNKSLFDDLANAYGLDVENWKTMAQAKAEIDQKLIQSLSAAWSKYYNIVVDSTSGMASVEGVVGSEPEGADGEMSKAQRNALDAAFAATDKYNDVINKFNEAANITVNVPDFGGIGTIGNKSGGSDKKKKEDTEKEIDWIERKLKLLEEKRSDLKNLSDNSYIDYLGINTDEFNRAKELLTSDVDTMIGGADELNSIAQKAGMTIANLHALISTGAPSESKGNYLAQVLEVDKTLLDQYAQSVAQYQSEYDKSSSKISAQNKAKIELGDMSIDTLPSDEAETVQTAMNDFDKLRNAKSKQYEMQSIYLDDIKAKYDNISESIANENKQLENTQSLLEAQMDYFKASGEIVGESYYNKLIDNTVNQIKTTDKDIENKRAELKDLLNNGATKDSEDYINLKSEISDAEKSVYSLKKAQEEYNNALLQMPIDNLSTVINMYKDINTAISNWGAEIESSGKKLDSNYYQEMISNGSAIIDQYKEQASLIGNVMDEYEAGSDPWYELYGQLQSVNSEMSSMVQNLQKWNEELLKMPLENINNYTSELQKVADGLSGVKEEYDTVINAVTGAIKEQIDTINEQKDAVNEEYDAQKKALQDKLDLMNKQNKELQLQQKYEQALYNLQKANQQATEKVIRDGQVVYEQNADKLRDAQEAVQDAKFDMETNKIQTQIDELQETLDGLNEKYQDQIDSLQKISDKWSEISEKITRAQNEAKANELLGVGWKDKVLSGKDVELFNNFSGMYANTAEQLRQYQEQINTTNNIYSLLEDYITSYKEGTLSYDDALTKINGLLSQMNQTMSAGGNLQNIYDYLGAMNGTAANAESVLSGIKQGLTESANQLLDSFVQYNKNAGMISEYTSSWQQLTNNVSEMLNVLEEVRDNLDNASDDDDESYDKSRGKGWGTGDVNNGPGVNLSKATSRKEGIKKGLVGSSSTSDREAKMKLLGMQKMDQDEIAAVLHRNEAVFNPEQQDMLLKNLVTAWNFTPPRTDYSNFLPNRQKSTTQEFNFNGGINIQECNDTVELAQGILNGGLKSAIIQEVGKR